MIPFESRCPYCGMEYENLRTGLSFREVRLMMNRPGPPPWRQKRRRSVLGFWHEIKLTLWRQHIDECSCGYGFLFDDEVPF